MRLVNSTSLFIELKRRLQPAIRQCFENHNPSLRCTSINSLAYNTLGKMDTITLALALNLLDANQHSLLFALHGRLYRNYLHGLFEMHRQGLICQQTRDALFLKTKFLNKFDRVTDTDELIELLVDHDIARCSQDIQPSAHKLEHLLILRHRLALISGHPHYASLVNDGKHKDLEQNIMNAHHNLTLARRGESKKKHLAENLSRLAALIDTITKGRVRLQVQGRGLSVKVIDKTHECWIIRSNIPSINRGFFQLDLNDQPLLLPSAVVTIHASVTDGPSLWHELGHALHSIANRDSACFLLSGWRSLMETSDALEYPSMLFEALYYLNVDGDRKASQFDLLNYFWEPNDVPLALADLELHSCEDLHCNRIHIRQLIRDIEKRHGLRDDMLSTIGHMGTYGALYHQYPLSRCKAIEVVLNDGAYVKELSRLLVP